MATPKKEVKAKTGRPSSYKQEYNEVAAKLSLLGMTDKELAGFFGVSEQTLNKWKKDYPEFLESLKKGKEVADANVASRLYRRAIGYDFDETVKEKRKDANGIYQMVETKVVKKHVPADTTAAIFWLKNRQPEKWRDRKELDATVNLGDELESMSDEQLKKIIDGEEK
ncbi:MAG: helix-turn-helix domain-containing protein [Phocaeicola sp.]